MDIESENYLLIAKAELAIIIFQSVALFFLLRTREKYKRDLKQLHQFTIQELSKSNSQLDDIDALLQQLEKQYS